MTDNKSNPPHNDPAMLTSQQKDVTDNIANIEKYFLHSKGEIIQKLRVLAKSKSSITAYFNHGNDFFLTGIVEVLKDRNILVLDISPDQALNKKIIQSDHIVLKTKHLGISAQFSTDSIQTAKFQGQQFLACTIPDELLWVQRREHFRVQIPLCDNAVFQIKNEEGELADYRIIDVSGGGIAIADDNFTLKVEAGDRFEGINLIFNDKLSCTTNLVIQNTLPIKHDSPSAGQRIGCSFELLRTDFAAELQLYINQLDSHYRKTIES